MKTIIASGASHAEFQANSQAKKMPGDLTRKCIYRSTTRNLYNSIKSNFIVSVQTSLVSIFLLVLILILHVFHYKHFLELVVAALRPNQMFLKYPKRKR